MIPANHTATFLNMYSQFCSINFTVMMMEMGTMFEIDKVSEVKVKVISLFSQGYKLIK